MSSIVNKAKDALTGHEETTTSTTTTTAHTGPHKSNLANKVDPRAGPNLDGRAGGYSSTHNAGGSTNYGPHETNIGNKLDPRVDSDRDGRARHGVTAEGQGLHGATGHGTSETHRSGTTGNTGYGTSTNYRPHDSSLADKLDPLVDTDVGRHHPAGTAGTAGYGNNTSANYGPHDSSLANKVDPRVDSNLDHRGPGIHTTTGTGTSGTSGTHRSSGAPGDRFSANLNAGPAPNTAGPHKSDMMNKLDPRVDSDLDGSKTVGSKQQTY